MTAYCFVIWTFLLLCISCLALPSPTPSAAPLQAEAAPAPTLALADEDLWGDEPVPITYVTDTTAMKFINTHNYFWKGDGNKHVVVDAQDPTYTLKYGSEVTCRDRLIAYEFDQLHAASVGGSELLLMSDSQGRLVTLSQTPEPDENCPIVKKLISDNVFVHTSLDTHRSLGVFFTSHSPAAKLQFEFAVIKLQADGNHEFKAHLKPAPVNYEYSYEPYSGSMTTFASLGTTGDDVVVFTPAEHGITAYHGHVDGELTEVNVSADSELQSATGCIRMTRIGVTDELITSTTVTLAVACANDGAGKLAVYVVQVPVVEGVPQTLKITASMVLKQFDFEKFNIQNGSMDYLKGSLIIATEIYIFSFVLSEPESPRPTLSPRSWFSSSISIQNISFLTESAALVSTPGHGTYNSPVVLHLDQGRVIQPSIGQNTGDELVDGLTGSYVNISAGARLSDTSFATVGYDNGVRRWESCAGLGHDYTAAMLDTSDTNAPSVTCSCPADKYCLLGTVYDTCPEHTTLSDGQCVPNTGVLVDRSALSFNLCPAGHYCTNNVKTPCTANEYQPLGGQTGCETVSTGFYSTPESEVARTSQAVCPVGYKCEVGIRTPCTGANYQLNEGQTTCSTCKAGHHVTTENGANTACTQCLAGTFSSSGATTSCTPCPAPTYSGAGASSCSAGDTCQAGYKVVVNDADNGTACIICEAGTHSTAAGATTCTACPAGTYPSINGAYASEGATACTSCPAQKTCNGVHEPASCTGANFTSNDAAQYVTEGASKCLACSSGHKCEDGVRTPCTGNEYQPLSGKGDCDTVTTGFYSTPESEVARTSQAVCPAGHKCEDGVKIPCTGNDYQSHDRQTSCYTCPDHSDATIDNTNCTVHDGYVISSGSFEDGDAVIATCPGGYKCVGGVKALGTPLIAAIVVAVVVVCVLAAGLAFFLHRKSRNSKAEANTTEMTQV